MLDADGYAYFKKLVLAALPGAAAEDVDLCAVPYRDTTVGLENLALGIAHEPRSTWKRRLDEFLQGLADDTAIGSLSTDELRRRLRIRLITPGAYGRENAFIGPMVADDLQAAVTIDLPSKVMFARPAELEKLGLPIEELIEIGLDNIFKMRAPKPTTIEMGRAKLVCYDDADMSTASRLLRSDALMNVSPNGALAIVPSAHFLNVVNIESLAVVDALTQLPVIAPKLYVNNPHPCSESVYWWRDAKIERIAITQTDKTIGMAPSDALMEVLNSLT